MTNDQIAMTNLPTTCRALTQLAVAWPLALVLMVNAAPAIAQAPALAPHLWQQRLFFVPYQVNRQDPAFQSIGKVQLLVSRDGASDWRVLEEAEPTVQGFSYHAPEDGEYWLALRHLDRQGQPWPHAAVQPQMRIVVDTLAPELQLSGSVDASGAVVIRYEARDASLDAPSLRLEVRPQNGNWSPLAVSEPDVTHVDRLLGRASWTPPLGVPAVEVRGSIADKTGRRGEATTEVSLANAPPPSNLASRPLGPVAREWPADNQLPAEPPPSALASTEQQAPPEANPYASSGPPGEHARTPARLVGEGPTDPRAVRDAAAPVESKPHSAQPTTLAEGPGGVNSLTFDIDYDLQTVGPWGVAKVELWGTTDAGRTWRRFAVDADAQSPVRVTVPGNGDYGFRIVVDGGNGVAAEPQSGERPELTVLVDTQPPSVENVTAELGTGERVGQLQVRWTATDANFLSQPITLLYSSFPSGPWSKMCESLPNTGSYVWQIERHVPDRFYVRLEARDSAGNVGASQLPQPITITRPQPTGRLRGVRAVEGGSEASQTQSL